MTHDPVPSPAAMYEEYFVPAIFRPLSRIVLDRADLRPGERVLDLACGTGILARQAAPAVGAGGRVVALDLRDGMLAHGRSLPPPDGAAIEWRQGDATALDLPPGQLDVVLCQQGLQFFPDRPAAAREMRRVLAPGGRAVIAVWQGIDQQPLYAEMIEAERRHLAALGLPADDADTPFRFGDAAALQSVLEDAGFSRVEVQAAAIDAAFPVAAFVRRTYLAYAAVVPAFAEDRAAFEAFVTTMERATADVVARFTRGDRITSPMRTHLAVARA